MQPLVSVGEGLGALARRLDSGGASLPGGPGAVGHWAMALTTVLAVLAIGRIGARLADRLARRSAPELAILLNQSAAFYGRWPQDRLSTAPRDEVVAEAQRCERIIELLQSRVAADTCPATRGPIDGLRAWTALLNKRIEGRQGWVPAAV